MKDIPELLPADPLPLFCEWYEQALQQQSIPTRDAMTLATATPAGQVSARVVLCKEIVADPGYLVFYTNYESEKGLQIAANAQVAAVFHWDELGRQARIEGIAIRSPAEESDRYFQSRDRDSQIGAWTSAQSQPIASHADLLEKHAAMLARFGTTADAPAVPRPPHWGGFRLAIAALELWDRGAARLHDRARWERPVTLENDGFSAGIWQAKRLQP